MLVLSLNGVWQVHADIRDDIADAKSKIKQYELDILEYDKKIRDARILVFDNEQQLKIEKDEEKKIRATLGASWTAQQELEQAQKDIVEAQKILDTSKKELQILIDTRNEIRKNILRTNDILVEIDKPEPVKPTLQTGIIGITIDNTCKTFIKNNLSSNCPTFEAIDQLYPGSVCEFEGALCIDYYKQIGGFHYLIDPSAAIMERIKMVEIRHNFEEFHLQGDAGYSNEDHTINYQIGRHVDGCKNIYINSESWIKYTGDSIYYFHNGCNKKYSYLDDSRTEYINQTTHDPATSYKYQLDKWIKESKEKCLSKCFEY